VLFSLSSFLYFITVDIVFVGFDIFWITKREYYRNSESVKGVFY